MQKNNKVAVIPYTRSETEAIRKIARELDVSFSEACKRLAVVAYKSVPNRDESRQSVPNRVKA